MTLWDLKLNQEAIIDHIEESSPCFQRLESYGFTNGEKAKFLYKTALQGPRVYLLGDSVYSLSQQVASQIMIHMFTQNSTKDSSNE